MPLNQSERQPGGGNKLRIFMSYARADAAFVLQLVAALETRDLQVVIDTRDLPLAVEFQNELRDLIAQADAVVCVLSPAAIASKWVAWEIEQVESLSKRLVPVVAQVIDNALIPVAVAKINYVFFDGESRNGERFEQQVDLLVQALTMDLSWLKAHTRWAERGRRWNDGGRRRGHLLGGAELDEAESWLATQPATGPPPSTLQREFLLASRVAATRRLRFTVSGALGIAILTGGLAVLYYIQRQVADANAMQARRSLSLADQRRATELTTDRPPAALAYYARALRNDPTNFSIGRQTLYLLGAHPYVYPYTRSKRPTSSPFESRLVLIDDASSVDTVTSPDGTWAVSVDDKDQIQVKPRGSNSWVTLDSGQEYEPPANAAVFTDRSEYALIVGTFSTEFGATSTLRLVDRGAKFVGRVAFGGEVIRAVAFSPDTRLLAVVLPTRTLIMHASPTDERTVLTEVYSRDGSAKTLNFSANSEFVQIDDDLFRVAPVLLQESLPQLKDSNVENVEFSDDSTTMTISGSGGPESSASRTFDTRTGKQVGSRPAPQIKDSHLDQATIPELQGAASAGGIVVTRGERIVRTVPDSRIVMGGFDGDNQLIWFRDDGTMQIMLLSDGVAKTDWGLPPQIVGTPWHELSDGFLTIQRGRPQRWTPIYEADDLDLDRWTKVFGEAIKRYGFDSASSVFVDEKRNIAALCIRGDSRTEVILIDTRTGDAIRDPFVVNEQHPEGSFSHDGSWFAIEALDGGSGTGPIQLLDVNSGELMIPTTFHGGGLVERPDGRRAVVLGGEGSKPVIVDILGQPTNVPDWLAELAEATSGLRLDNRNVLHAVSQADRIAVIDRIRNTVLAGRTNDRWVEFARWHLTDDEDPTISPYSPLKRRAFARDSAVSSATPLPSSSPTKGVSSDWQIQVGAFKDSRRANEAMAAAARKFRSLLSKHPGDVLPSGQGLYRVRFKSFTQSEARDACSTIRGSSVACVPVPSN